MLVVFGPKGIGKTTLLRELNQKFSQRTPRAFVDCSRDTATEIRQLLIDVKFQFGRYCPGVGRPRFRRLEIGLAATRRRIDFSGNPRHAVRTLLDLILREISLHPDDVGGTVGNWVDGGTFGVIPRWLRRVATTMVATVSRMVSRRLLLRLLRRYVNWYGHRDQGEKDSPIDVLSSLNRWSFDPTMRVRRDERLLEAFLADIRDLFARGRLARSEWFNCVLLIDDVDTDVGQTVLKHLRQLRTDLRIAGAAAEPLLVIASSHRPLSGEDLQQRRLPEFTEPETGWLAEHVPGAKRTPGEADHRFHKVLHQLTGGHPWATALLTDAAYHHPSAASDGLDTLLTTRFDDNNDLSVEERVFHELVTALLRQPGQLPFPDDALDSFITCALALTQEEADWLAEHQVNSFAVTPVLLGGSGLWNEDERTAAHDLLRRLMLRRLAARELPPTWQTVCTRLHARRRQSSDLAGELYYTLASGELSSVVHRLAEHLNGQGIEQSWLSLTRFVTSAPRPMTDSAVISPYQQQVDLAKTVVADATSHLGQVAQLTAGLWLDNDPCTAPDREDLHHQIALDYRTIAPRADQPMSLRREAKRHDELARYWS